MYKPFYNTFGPKSSDTCSQGDTPLSIVIDWYQYDINDPNAFKLSYQSNSKMFKVKKFCPSSAFKKTPKYAVCKMNSVIPSVMQIINAIQQKYNIMQVPICVNCDNQQPQQMQQMQQPQNKSFFSSF